MAPQIGLTWDEFTSITTRVTTLVFVIYNAWKAIRVENSVRDVRVIVNGRWDAMQAEVVAMRSQLLTMTASRAAEQQTVAVASAVAAAVSPSAAPREREPNLLTETTVVEAPALVLRRKEP